MNNHSFLIIKLKNLRKYTYTLCDECCRYSGVVYSFVAVAPPPWCCWLTCMYIVTLLLTVLDFAHIQMLTTSCILTSCLPVFFFAFLHLITQVKSRPIVHRLMLKPEIYYIPTVSSAARTSSCLGLCTLMLRTPRSKLLLEKNVSIHTPCVMNVLYILLLLLHLLLDVADSHACTL